MNNAGQIDGRTTVLILKAMAEARLNRGKYIDFHDHRDLSADWANALLPVMKQMAEALGLDYEIHVSCESSGPFIRVRWQKEQAGTATVSDLMRSQISLISKNGLDSRYDHDSIKLLSLAVLGILDRLDQD